MLIHVGLILSLSCLTAGMEFMPEPEVSEVAKNVFMVLSFLGYYLFLFLVGRYAREEFLTGAGFLWWVVAAGAAFALLMGVGFRSGWFSIALSVVFVYTVFGVMVRHSKKTLARSGRDE